MSTRDEWPDSLQYRLTNGGGPRRFARGGIIPKSETSSADRPPIITGCTGGLITNDALKNAKRDAWRRSAGLLPPLPIDLNAPMVCVTHQRFIPCRVDDGCRMSQEPADVEAVRRYQRGDNA